MAAFPGPARSDILSQQDGLHAVLTSPQFRDALGDAVSSYFGQIFEPHLLELLRRFLTKGERNDAFSVLVKNDRPYRLLERDPSRVEAWVYNNDAVNTLYVGGRQVTVGTNIGDASAGFPVAPKAGFIVDRSIGELYGITTVAAGIDVRVLDLIGGIVGGPV